MKTAEEILLKHIGKAFNNKSVYHQRYLDAMEEYAELKASQSQPTDEQIEKESEKVIMNYLTDNNPDGDFKHSTIGADDKRIWWCKGAKAIRDNKITK